MRILLIEDEAGDAELVRKALSKGGETDEVHWVTRLGAALEHPHLAACDVIMADLSLPDSCGLKAVATLRKRLPEMPLIVLTSLANDAVALQAIDLGHKTSWSKTTSTPRSCGVRSDTPCNASTRSSRSSICCGAWSRARNC